MKSKLHFPCIGDVMVDFDRFRSEVPSADCYRMRRLEVGERMEQSVDSEATSWQRIASISSSSGWVQ